MTRHLLRSALVPGDGPIHRYRRRAAQPCPGDEGARWSPPEEADSFWHAPRDAS